MLKDDRIGFLWTIASLPVGIVPYREIECIRKMLRAILATASTALIVEVKLPPSGLLELARADDVA